MVLTNKLNFSNLGVIQLYFQFNESYQKTTVNDLCKHQQFYSSESYLYPLRAGANH